MIKINSNSGLQILLNPSHIASVSNDGDVLGIYTLNNTFLLHLSESDGDNLLCAERYQLLWLQLQEL